METNKIFEITININLYILSLYFAFMIAVYVFEKERGAKAQESFYKFIHLTRSIHKDTKKEMPTYIINNENYSNIQEALPKIMKIFYEIKNGRIEKKRTRAKQSIQNNKLYIHIRY